MSKKQEIFVELKQKDAVVALPVNAVQIEITVSFLDEKGQVQKAKRTMDAEEIRQAFNLFEKTCDGDYPVYALTEEGKRYAEELRRERGE